MKPQKILHWHSRQIILQIKMAPKLIFETRSHPCQRHYLVHGQVGVVLAVGTRNPWGILQAPFLTQGTLKKTVPPLATPYGPLNSWRTDGIPGHLIIAGTVTFDLVKYDFDACKEGPVWTRSSNQSLQHRR